MAVRVLYINDVAGISGVGTVLLTLLQGIDRREFEPLVLCPPGELTRGLSEIGVPVHAIPLPRPRRTIHAARELLRTALFSRWLGHKLREWRVGLVHANSLTAQMIAGGAAQEAGLPVIWHMHSILRRRWPNGSLLRHAARNADRVICVSRAVARELEAWDVPRQKLAVIYNGLDLEHRFRPLPATGLLHAQYGLPRDTQLVAIIGQLTPTKGQDIFIRAAVSIAADHPRAVFLIVGAPLFADQRWMRQLQCLAESVELGPRMIFAGARDDIPAVLAEVKMVVHASVAADSLPTVLLEAGAMAKPAVATTSGGASEIIADGHTGLLVPPGDVEAMAAAMDRLLSNPAAAARMGAAARHLVEDRFAMERFVARTEGLYLEVLCAPPKAVGFPESAGGPTWL